jgi:hypothetical protein
MTHENTVTTVLLPVTITSTADIQTLQETIARQTKELEALREGLEHLSLDRNSLPLATWPWTLSVEEMQIAPRGSNFVADDVDAVMRMESHEAIAELQKRGYTNPNPDIRLGMWVLLERDRERRMQEQADLHRALVHLRKEHHADRLQLEGIITAKKAEIRALRKIVSQLKRKRSEDKEDT